jgi:hypothetical protein
LWVLAPSLGRREGGLRSGRRGSSGPTVDKVPLANSHCQVRLKLFGFLLREEVRVIPGMAASRTEEYCSRVGCVFVYTLIGFYASFGGAWGRP